MSDAARHARLKALFDAALERSGTDRHAYVEDAAGDDPALAAEVRALLEAHVEATTGLLERGAPREPASHAGLGLDRGWRIVRELARGGMGVVYLAERADGAYEQRVALKLLHAAAIDSETIVRVKLERQILARLSHPNIARLLDGGTDANGAPYLVMEYVEGERIDRWCERHVLSVEARIALFLAVCDAVAYAHRNLVVHRDLKPSNILVGADGAPKLLDFGIAKLIEDDAALTGEGERMLTPRYASPEQVRGEPVTTLSDVYSLGVVLYELLGGDSPYGEDASSASRLAHAICERDPGAPSAAVAASARTLPAAERREGVRKLRGDLDAIVLRALRKSPGERYASAEAFAEDLRAHLERRPVAARRGDFAYRARRFVARHWAALATLLAVAVLSAAFMLQLQRQLAATEVERDKSRRVVAFLTDLFRVADPSESRGNTVTVREVLERGARTLSADRALDPAVRATLLGSVARVYAQLGLSAQAAPLLDGAVAAARDADAATLADALVSLGAIRTDLGDYAGAESALAEAATIQAAGGAGPDDVLTARRQYFEGQLRLRQGRLDEAVAPLRASLQLRRRVFGPQARETAEAITALAGVARDRGDLVEAERGMREALAAVDATGGDPWTRAKLVNNLAVIAGDRGDFAAAEANFREVLTLMREVLGATHPNVASALGNLASMMLRRGAYDEALPLLEQAYALRRDALGADHPQSATSLANLAYARFALGDFERAANELDAALAAQRTLAPGHLHRLNTLRNLAAVRYARGDIPGAVAASQAVLDEGTASAAHPIVRQAAARRAVLRCFEDESCDAATVERAVSDYRGGAAPHGELHETRVLALVALLHAGHRGVGCARAAELAAADARAGGAPWDIDVAQAVDARCRDAPAAEVEARVAARYGAAHPATLAITGAR